MDDDREDDDEDQLALRDGVAQHDFLGRVHLEQGDHCEGKLDELDQIQQIHDFVDVEERDDDHAGNDGDGSKN